MSTRVGAFRGSWRDDGAGAAWWAVKSEFRPLRYGGSAFGTPPGCRAQVIPADDASASTATTEAANLLDVTHDPDRAIDEAEDLHKPVIPWERHGYVSHPKEAEVKVEQQDDKGGVDAGSANQDRVSKDLGHTLIVQKHRPTADTDCIG